MHLGARFLRASTLCLVAFGFAALLSKNAVFHLWESWLVAFPFLIIQMVSMTLPRASQLLESLPVAFCKALRCLPC
jgi:hypothetical protein